ncbi:MAG: preprotein translocase subunit YajC [Syntrophomonadaceae bacterium]|jgi:preprotein translocase subunit YajC|nr:preprotein translocase subunit YajC [Syntrophomonadaceae bacterium]
MNEWLSLVAYFAVFIGIFYFLIIMPRKKQEKKHNSLLEALQRGDKVITIGGIKGEITRIKDDTVSLRVNETMQIELLKKAIAYKEGEEPK